MTSILFTVSFYDLCRLLVVILLWAICYPLINTGLNSSPPLLFAAMRSVMAGMTLIVFGLATGRSFPTGKIIWFILVLVGIFSSTLGFTGMFYAGDKISPGLATVLSNIQPLIAAIIGYFSLRERLDNQIVFALLLGFIGVNIISFNSIYISAGNSTLSGIFYVILGATGVAVGNVLLKRSALHIDPVMAIGWSFLIGGIVLLLFSFSAEDASTLVWSLEFLFIFVVLSIFGTAIVYVIWFDLMTRNELNRLNTFTFLTPVFGLIIAALFYNEHLTLVEWTGTITIMLAAIVAGKASRHRELNQ